MGTARERKALQGASRFDLEQNYVEFQRVHGFDIREQPFEPKDSTHPPRDTRDPQRVGEALKRRRRRAPTLPFSVIADRVLGSFPKAP